MKGLAAAMIGGTIGFIGAFAGPVPKLDQFARSCLAAGHACSALPGWAPVALVYGLCVFCTAVAAGVAVHAVARRDGLATAWLGAALLLLAGVASAAVVSMAPWMSTVESSGIFCGFWLIALAASYPLAEGLRRLQRTQRPRAPGAP